MATLLSDKIVISIDPQNTDVQATTADGQVGSLPNIENYTFISSIRSPQDQLPFEEYVKNSVSRELPAIVSTASTLVNIAAGEYQQNKVNVQLNSNNYSLLKDKTGVLPNLEYTKIEIDKSVNTLPVSKSSWDATEGVYSWSKNKIGVYQDTITGQDLCVFILMETPYPDIESTDGDLSLTMTKKKNNTILLELTNCISCSYSTMREKFPVRALGSINPKTHLAGARSISGHLAFSIFAEDILSQIRSQVREEVEKIELNIKRELNETILAEDRRIQAEQIKASAKAQEKINTKSYIPNIIVNPNYNTGVLPVPDFSEKIQPPSVGPLKSTADLMTQMENNNQSIDMLPNINSQYSDFIKKKFAYLNTSFLNDFNKTLLLDQLPPFHLLIMGVSELGTFTRMLLRNCTIIDENQYQGTQQPNIVNKVTFVAEDIVPMTKTKMSYNTIIESLNAISEQGIAQGLKGQTGSKLMNDLFIDATNEALELGLQV